MVATLKNVDLLALNGVLEKYMSVRQNKIAYALAKNKQALGVSLRAYLDLVSLRQKELNALVGEGGVLHDYEEARQVLCKKHAEKDSKGKPKVQGRAYVIEDQVAFDKELRSLSKKYTKELQERANIEKLIAEALEEESEFVPYCFPIELVETCEDDIFEARDLLHLMERGIIIDKDAESAPKIAAKNDKVTPIKKPKKA